MMKVLLRTTILAAFLSLTGAPQATAQTATKPPLEHESYDIWNRISARALSPDGAWLAYVLTPGEGDGTLMLRGVDSGAELALDRGANPTFTDDSRFLIATVEPPEEEVEAARERRREDDSVELPKDQLVVIPIEEVFRSGAIDPTAIVRIDDVQSFEVPQEDRSLVAYLLEAEEPEEDEEAQQEEQPQEEEEEQEPSPREQRREDKDDGAPLVLRNLDSGSEFRFEHVVDYDFTEDGERLYFTASSKDGTADGVTRVRTSDGSTEVLLGGEGRYLHLAISDGESGSGAVAFATDRDDQESEEPALALYVADRDAGQARLLVAADAPGIPEGWWIAENGGVRFSEEGSRVFFGTDERPEPEPEEDEENEEDDGEEVVVDVWNWKDDYLQPMQLIEAEREENRSYDAIVPADGGPVLQLESQEFPSVSVPMGGEAEIAMTSTDLPYRQLLSWDGRYSDVYLVDLETGEKEMVLEMLGRGASFSPDGSYLSWFDGVEKQWFAMDVASRSVSDLTSQLPHAVHDELDDHPDEPPPYGAAGWTEDGDFVVYDRHDIWIVDPDGSSPPRNVTEGVGRREGLRFRYLRTDPEADYVPTDEEVFLSAFHFTEKDAGFYRDHFGGEGAPSRMVMTADSYGFPQKAEDADRYLLTRENFVDFADLYVADADLSRFERMSEANPQQSEYRWGTAEIYEWMSADGEPLQGILYKPEGFDSDEQYPMMVYFYERSSDGIHRYAVPSAGGSSINRSFYVSRGYLLFVPDIPYEIGFPGESALDAVVPGVLALIDEGFVKPDKIGVQGHSWGGYQIAHMITRTNLFAAAEAGAPVSNMTSAYGGIRWASGMSRMFQYERTQSRIGGTLWDAQHRYIENSPIFFADKVQTPLLMMHNDEDGAVPWYQGIEMFVSLRRLQKPVWMLNYNGEAHGLRQEHNQKDWAIRMQQFFDHFLMDAPPPVWLAEGVPAELKGKTLGLELVTKPITEEGSGPGGSR